MPPEDEKPTPKEVCTMRIIFPVYSDEDALKAKRYFQEYLKQIPDAQIHFMLVPNIHK